MAKFGILRASFAYPGHVLYPEDLLTFIELKWFTKDCSRKDGFTMTMKRNSTFSEKVLDSLSDFADALKNGEDIPRKYSCRKVVLDLAPTPYSSELVVETRKVLELSQAVFARFLGVATGTVSSWEQGDRAPDRLACRFMDEIRNDPDYWRNRLRELIRPKSKGSRPEASAM